MVLGIVCPVTMGGVMVLGILSCYHGWCYGSRYGLSCYHGWCYGLGYGFPVTKGGVTKGGVIVL